MPKPFHNIRKIFLFIVLLSPFLFASICFAARIALTSGEVFDAPIIEKTKDFVRLEVDGIQIVYYLDEVATIDGEDLHSKSFEPTAQESRQEAPVEEAVIEQPSKAVEVIPAPQQVQPIAPRVPKQTKLFDVNPNPTQELIDRLKSQEGAKERWQGNYFEYQIARQKEIQKNKILRKFEELKTVYEAQKEKLKESNPELYKKYMAVEAIFIKRTDIIAEKCYQIMSLPRFFLFFVIAIFYILFCCPVMLIAQKLGVKRPWVAWIPLANVFLLADMAGISSILLIGFFIPIVNIFVFMEMWGKISSYLQQPYFLGFLTIIPGINIIVIWYLALIKTK